MSHKALLSALATTGWMLLMATPVQAATIHIHTINFSFSPNDVTIDQGDTGQWDNHDGVTHTVTDVLCPRAGGPGPCEFDSQFTMTPGATFTHTFNAAATFNYKCTIHGFTGILRVVDPNARPDLFIANIQFQDFNPPGNLFAKQIRVTVSNQGTAGSPASQLRVEYQINGNWNQISLADVPPVAVGGSQMLTITWSTTGKIGDYPIRATSDPNDTLSELNELNNQLMTTVSLILPPGTLPGKDLLHP